MDYNEYTNFNMDIKSTLYQLSTVEVAQLSPLEKEQYEAKLKVYRDLKNVIDTAFEEGRRQAKEAAQREIAKPFIIALLELDKLSIEKIASMTNSTMDYILQVKNEHPL